MNYYQILGVRENASQEEMKKAEANKTDSFPFFFDRESFK